MIGAGRTRIYLISLIIILITIWGVVLGKTYYYSNVDNVQKSDVIIVMGASQWSGKPSPVFRNRLEHAIELFEYGYADKIILTGGVGDGETISESQAGKDFLEENGVNEQNIFMEEAGRTSLESIQRVVPILKKNNYLSVILVSDGFHMMRIREMFINNGYTPLLSPVVAGAINQDAVVKAKFCVRESVVYLLYKIFNV